MAGVRSGCVAHCAHRSRGSSCWCTLTTKSFADAILAQLDRSEGNHRAAVPTGCDRGTTSNAARHQTQDACPKKHRIIRTSIATGSVQPLIPAFANKSSSYTGGRSAGCCHRDSAELEKCCLAGNKADCGSTCAYDGISSHLTSITDTNNHAAVTMTYDSQGRVATQKDAQGLSAGQNTAFSYVANIRWTEPERDCEL